MGESKHKSLKLGWPFPPVQMAAQVLQEILAAPLTVLFSFFPFCKNPSITV